MFHVGRTYEGTVMSVGNSTSLSVFDAGREKIAEYISQNNEQVLMMSIDELAKLTGTAKSAVIRCSKSLGFDGYTVLKISLAADVTRKDERDYSNSIDVDETADSIANKIFSANIRTLQDTIHFLNIPVLEKVVNLIAEARMIYIYGVGTSAIFGTDFQHRLFQIGYSAIVVTDVATMKDSTLNIKEGDVAFAFSDSGRTIVTVETMKLAKEKSATTICLTGYTDSPITEVCDYALFTTADEFKYPIESITSRVARVAVIDALIVTLSVMNYSNSLEKMTQTRRLVSDTRYPKVGEDKL